MRLQFLVNHYIIKPSLLVCVKSRIRTARADESAHKRRTAHYSTLTGRTDDMSEPLLTIENLCVSVEDEEILNGLSLTVNAGETHVLMGPNGAGKSTLGNVLMGHPAYRITKGSLRFRGEELSGKPPELRARAGLFMSFQTPPEIAGISLENFLRNALEQRTGKRVKLWDFHKELTAAMALLQMEPSYAERDFNVGFSGGEKKKSEILQLLMLKPALAILDETDSGLDVDAVRAVSEGVRAYQEGSDSALIVITHSTAILSALRVDAVHILADGRFVKEGGAELIDEITQNGFAAYEDR